MDHVGDLRPEDLALALQGLDGLDEELVAVPLAETLYGEDEVVLASTEADLALELGVPQHLAADGVAHGVLDNSLDLALVALVPAAFGPRLGARHGLQPCHTLGKAPDELPGVVAEDRPQDLDRRHQTVARGRDGRVLGVVPAVPLVHVHVDVDLLTGAHLGDQDVGVDWPNSALAGEVLSLPPEQLGGDVGGVDVGVMVQLPGVALVVGGVLIVGALDLQLELNGVVVEGGGEGVLALPRLLPEGQEVADAGLAAGEGDQAQTVGQHLVLDDARIVVNEDGLDGEGGDLGDQDPPEGVGDGGVDADEGELRVELLI